MDNSIRMVTTINKELCAAGHPVTGFNSSGTISFTAGATEDQKASAYNFIKGMSLNPDDYAIDPCLQIDATTGALINSRVHELCGAEEQLGIIRDQITRMLNGDMTPSDELTALVSIATAAIEEGQAKKAVLDA